MTIPEYIICLIPEEFVRWHIARLRNKVYVLRTKRDKHVLCLEGLEQGFEYTESFRLNLVRKINDSDVTRAQLWAAADYLENALALKT